jgi:hypothetical protein
MVFLNDSRSAGPRDDALRTLLLFFCLNAVWQDVFAEPGAAQPVSGLSPSAVAPRRTDVIGILSRPSAVR